MATAAVTPAPASAIGGISDKGLFWKRLYASLGHTRVQLTVFALVLMFMGFLCIAIYSFATPGAHWQYFAVGVLTSVSVLVVGYLIGFLFGIPRIISSGQLRMETTTQLIAHAKSVQGGQTDSSTPAPRAVPSSNLAEVSDWLTKLLLGAGLVSLTKLGQPLGDLVNTIASGLQGSTPPVVTGPPQVMAAGIMFGYVTLGFLIGYIATSLWYSRHLDKIVNASLPTSPR